MSFLAGLPERGEKTAFEQRMAKAIPFVWFGFGGVGCFGGLVAGQPAIAGPCGVLFMVLHMSIVFAGISAQARRRRALEEAKTLAHTDIQAAYAKAAEALRTATGSPKEALEAWLIVAQAAEEAGALTEADEALARGMWTLRQVDRGLVVHAHLLRAFVCGARGDVATAERELMTAGTLDLQNGLLYAEYMRARAMILYRKGQFKEVVDVVDEAFARAAIRNQRDAVLYASLKQSAMLRIEAAAGHHPMRIAHPEDAEAWLENVVPELSRRAIVR